MGNSAIFTGSEVHDKLPIGWEALSGEDSESKMAELRRELTRGHLLYDRRVEAIAESSGFDDVLFRHMDEPDRYTVIHLTWIGREEIDDLHPWVEFDGSFAQFVKQEKDLYPHLYS